MEDDMKRRDFLMAGLAGGAALSAFSCRKSTTSQAGPLPRRILGKTGESLSIIGMGGIVVMDDDPKTAARMVSDAVDRGVNYFDVAPSYGNAQEKLGPALEPFRKNCFLACKTTEREKAGAEKELNGSLKLLRTDHVDLYQLHALSSLQDVEKAFGPGGAMEVFVKARQEGKTRFLGFSAHSEEAALAAMDRFAFDTILLPVNFACWFGGKFGPAVLARAREKGMGILALKAMAHSLVREGETKPYKKCWYRPIEDEPLQALALRFTLSQGVTAAIPPGEPRFFLRALEIARDAAPITEKETALLADRAKTVESVFRT
jgi:predicted aldo/keto reductase-like oxidoreductase